MHRAKPPDVSKPKINSHSHWWEYVANNKQAKKMYGLRFRRIAAGFYSPNFPVFFSLIKLFAVIIKLACKNFFVNLNPPNAVYVY